MSAADMYTARELADKLEAAAGRRDEFHRRLALAWDALRMIARGHADPVSVAQRAMDAIKQ